MKKGFIDKLIDRIDRIEPGDARQVMLRLVAEKGFLEKVFEALQEGMVVIDPDGLVLYLNGAAARLFALDEEKALGQPVATLLDGLEVSDWSRFADAAADGKVVTRDLEVFYPENRVLNLCLAPVQAHDGQAPVASVLLLRDITSDRKLTEEKLESERVSTLTTLAAGVAHELGNPLNSLTIHLQLLERKLRKEADPELAEELGSMLGVAQGEIKRLNFIIEQFLGAMRPSSPQRALVRINDLIQDSVRVLEPELKDRQLSVVLELHAGIPLLDVDSEQIRQAFYNLIRNASQAMSEKGCLLVRSDLDDDWVHVTFTDDGKGIPAGNIGRIFEPYFTTRETGTGLGLLIVRRIVREHGGEIEIQSEEGQGTSVIVHLPRLLRGVRFLEDKTGQEED